MKLYEITLRENDKGIWRATTTLDDEHTVSYHADTPDEVLQLLAARFHWERQRATYITRFRQEEKS